MGIRPRSGSKLGNGAKRPSITQFPGRVSDLPVFGPEGQINMKRKRSESTAVTRPFKKPRLTRQGAVGSIMNPPGKKLARPEKKNFDISATGTIVAAQTTAVVNQLFTPDEGTGHTEHQGRKVNVRSLQYWWNGSLAATSGGSSGLRLVILFDKQTNAATPSTVTAFVTDVLNGARNLDYSERFIVLVDEKINCVGTAGPQSWFISGFRKLNLITEFNSVNNGTIGDITSGSYIAFTWQDGQIITADPVSRLRTRIMFTDA